MFAILASIIVSFAEHFPPGITSIMSNDLFLPCSTYRRQTSNLSETGIMVTQIFIREKESLEDS